MTWAPHCWSSHGSPSAVNVQASARGIPAPPRMSPPARRWYARSTLDRFAISAASAGSRIARTAQRRAKLIRGGRRARTVGRLSWRRSRTTSGRANPNRSPSRTAASVITTSDASGRAHDRDDRRREDRREPGHVVGRPEHDDRRQQQPRVVEADRRLGEQARGDRERRSSPRIEPDPGPDRRDVREHDADEGERRRDGREAHVPARQADEDAHPGQGLEVLDVPPGSDDDGEDGRHGEPDRQRPDEVPRPAEREPQQVRPDRRLERDGADGPEHARAQPARSGHGDRDRAHVQRHDVAEDEVVEVRRREQRGGGQCPGGEPAVPRSGAGVTTTISAATPTSASTLIASRRLGAADCGPDRGRRRRVEVVLLVGVGELEDVERLAARQAIGGLLVGDPVAGLLAQDRRQRGRSRGSRGVSGRRRTRGDRS